MNDRQQSLSLWAESKKEKKMTLPKDEAAREKNKIYTVSEVNQSIKAIFDNISHFKHISIEGEISNFTLNQRGHLYFTLKDKSSELRCVMFGARQIAKELDLKEGKAIVAIGDITVYQPRGQYQLLVKKISLAGLGKIYEKFLKLKNKLEKRGWFDPSLKKKIPIFPKKIGVITSPNAAALQDVCNVLNRRYPFVKLHLYPCSVQGIYAAGEISSAIAQADENKHLDVILVVRGGGSIEDLWPFNEEIVAKAIVDAHTPIISGVGHETDMTICDFVADFRAPTPSAAAECAVPDRKDLLDSVSTYSSIMSKAMTQKILALSQQLHIASSKIDKKQIQYRIDSFREKIIQVKHNLRQLTHLRFKEKQHRFDIFKSQILEKNPDTIMNKGYFKIWLPEKNITLTDRINLKKKDALLIQKKQHNIMCSVESIEGKKNGRKKDS